MRLKPHNFTPQNGGAPTGYNTWNYTYNSFGEVLTTTDPLNHTTTNMYDTHGNLLTTTTPSPDGGTTPGSTTTYTYYSNGTIKTIKDPLGNTTTLTYYQTGLINTQRRGKPKVVRPFHESKGQSRRRSVMVAESKFSGAALASARSVQLALPVKTSMLDARTGSNRST